MSAEFTQPGGNEEFEAATGEDIRVLTELIQSALNYGHEVLESSFQHECEYGRVVFKTRASVDDGELLIEPRIAVYTADDENGCSDMLLEYVCAPDGQIVEDYIVGDDGDSTALEAYAARGEIGDICRTLLLDTNLNPHERFVLSFFKRLVGATDPEEAPSPADEAKLGKALTEAMKSRDPEGEHVSIRSYSAIIENKGNIEVNGYILVHSPDGDMEYPRFEVEFDECMAGVSTTFVMPAEGEGEPELYREDLVGGMRTMHEDEDLPMAREHVELLSENLAAALTDTQLLDLEIGEIEEDEDEENEAGSDPLNEQLEAANLYFNLFAQAAEGSAQERTFYDRAFDTYQAFRHAFEARYHLEPDAVDITGTAAEDQLALLRLSGQNRLRILVPYIHHSNPQTGTYEIIELDSGEIVDFHYVEAVLCEIDDENQEVKYRGIGLSGYIEVDEPFINNPASGKVPRRHLMPVTIPLSESQLLTEAGSFYN